MALMSTGVNSCYFVDPDIGDRTSYDGHGERERVSNGLVVIQEASYVAKDKELEKGKRKQEGDHFTKAPKRLRLDSIWHTPIPSLCCNSTNQTNPNAILSPSPPTPSLALFRKPTRPPAKKYTRPPTKKVFESLKLTPEEWVRLEGEAKAYMLDTAHPDRQSCVGNRAIGPANDTKINLYKTVQRFLESDIGVRFFGVGVDVDEGNVDVGERWMYPRDETALISLLTPLMRRMVTNERQRQYARRTRAATQQQRAPSRDQSLSRLNASDEIPTQLVDVSAERISSHGGMEVFYLSKETKLFHRLAVDNVPPDFGKLHDIILAEYAHHKSADLLQSVKINVHGPYKLELVDDSNWSIMRDEIRSAAWTSEGTIKVIVQCD